MVVMEPRSLLVGRAARRRLAPPPGGAVLGPGVGPRVEPNTLVSDLPSSFSVRLLPRNLLEMRCKSQGEASR